MTPPSDAIEAVARRSRRWRRRAAALAVLLVVSAVANVVFLARWREYYAGSRPPAERFHDGDKGAPAKIARIAIVGTISPPFTARTLKAIERATEDDAVKGVLLVIDSPGGLVADSHQIYHRLKLLSEKKPVVVAMQRLCASGGLYVAMGGGPEARIYAEPTTWTGSIGVIIPRYDVSGLAEKIGVKSDSLKTGPFKDSLNPLAPLTPEETEVWRKILDDAFGRFIDVIADNRTPLDATQVRGLATGQVYTAKQALDAGLVDEIGYEDDAVASLKGRLKLDRARVIEYEFPIGLLDLIAPAAEAADADRRWAQALDRAVPKALYHCGGHSLSAELPMLSVP